MAGAPMRSLSRLRRSSDQYGAGADLDDYKSTYDAEGVEYKPADELDEYYSVDLSPPPLSPVPQSCDGDPLPFATGASPYDFAASQQPPHAQMQPPAYARAQQVGEQLDYHQSRFASSKATYPRPQRLLSPPSSGGFNAHYNRPGQVPPCSYPPPPLPAWSQWAPPPAPPHARLVRRTHIVEEFEELLPPATPPTPTCPSPMHGYAPAPADVRHYLSRGP